MDLAIDLHDVAKVYKGRVHALQGIEMRVARGEVFGLLGPNGAGKSTLVKIMMTVIRPTRAVGTILGQPVGHKPTLRRVGYLPENHRFPRYLTGRQTLEFFGGLAKVDRPTLRKRSAELLEVVGMRDWADRKVSTYSKGMMQRIGIGQALMSDPDLVVLDEPTDGVDPVGRRDIRDVLNRIREQGKTVFINSHLLSELEMMCNRVAILVQGQVARQGTINDLTAKSQRYDIEVEVPPHELPGLPGTLGARLGVAFEQAPAPLPAIPVGAPLPPGARPPPLQTPLHKGVLTDGLWIELRGGVLSIGTAEAAKVQPVLDALRQAGLTIRRVTPVRQSLEDLFMEAVTDPTTGQAFAPGAGKAKARTSGGVMP
ncbi:ABC transporter ATP-binding protein [Humisphaera borealis]|uniref:ATP-binding cassette domain-containing protein n=1 Tax=Humisphaera borealis TaxID=2807512 RepID=A0A7M2X375_9BACT|nr:ATP-binding cassette domain-containing protein [Humisphaera borealis]QOV92216.1 ATP-binding cassette domain-containing protein [Humisphaera borealis]